MSNRVKYLILGAGPSGLTLAEQLKRNNENDFLVLEKETVPGGLCRSEWVDDGPLDIGGGHILDVRRPKVNELIFEYMPENEWNLFDRDSSIHFRDGYVGHPFESNIWQMDIEDQVEFLESIAEAGCIKNTPMPEKFVEWIHWKLGDKVANEYMIPYNQKMFGDNLDELGTYWLEKLPDVSFRDTLRSCLERKPYGKQPGHSSFYYPKTAGYGEVFERIGKALGDKLILGTQVISMELMEGDLKKVKCSDDNEYLAEKVVTTIPWKSYELIGFDEKIVGSIENLKSTAVDIEYFSENMDTSAHWIYEPNPEVSYHRILVRHNFALGSKGHWTETRSERVALKKREGSYHYMNEYAYPLNTIGKPELMKRLLSYMKGLGIIGLGRWGEHNHYNSDVVMELAMNLAHRLINER